MKDNNEKRAAGVLFNGKDNFPAEYKDTDYYKQSVERSNGEYRDFMSQFAPELYEKTTSVPR